MLVNELHISGRVATEPKQYGNGPTKFRLAHGGGGERKDGTPWPTQFFSVTIWDKGAVEGLSKGTQIEVWGKLRHNEFTDRQGTKREIVEVAADTIKAQVGTKPITPDLYRAPNAHGVEVTKHDIPF